MRSADGERPARDGRRPVAQIVGLTLLAASALSAVIVANADAPYAIEWPGPVYDVLGDTAIDDTAVPMIEIVDAETHATDGVLDMLTINASDPRRPPSWLQVIEAYFDPARAVLPVEAVYPSGDQQSNRDRLAIQMANSKLAAIAAALGHLGHESTPTMRIAEVIPGTPADGIVEVGDLIVAANGHTLEDVDELRGILADNGVDRPAVLQVSRGGEPLTLEVVPTLSGEGPSAPVIGVQIASSWDWPVDVRIQLENVGGPSAGMMFALGIVDKLTPGSLTGGEIIAGTGTISATGEVGPIGGVRLKLYGALDAGAALILVPAANCSEVVGHVPGGLRVVPVGTLDDAVAALRTSAAGDTSALRTCEAILGMAA